MSLSKAARFYKTDTESAGGTGTEPLVSSTLPSVTLGRVVEIDSKGRILVSYPGSPESVAALVTAPCDASAVGREVALLFIEGDRTRPLVIGLIEKADHASDQPEAKGQIESTPVAHVDGKKLVFSAEQEIVLECGKSSITLTRAGKVLIRGAYLSSRSTGVNRIKGGSIQLN